MNVFFSYAGEDRTLVDQVFLRFCERYPDCKGWMDKYEIVGGDDLLAKISSGQNSADRFVIFLSKASVQKPWVQSELRRAIMMEINGKKQHFIIPVKIGDVPEFPAFIEHKLYISHANKTEHEFLTEVHNAITTTPAAIGESVPNLETTDGIATDDPTAYVVQLSARFFAEEIAFGIESKVPIMKSGWRFVREQKDRPVQVSELRRPDFFGVKLHSERITPGIPFQMWVKFEAPIDITQEILKFVHWDGVGGRIFTGSQKF